MIYIYKIERPDGTTFEQRVQLNKDETPSQGALRLRRALGYAYWVCDWRRDDCFQQGGNTK